MRRRVAVGMALALLAAARPAADTPLAGWFDLPVPGGASTLAALGIPMEERALTLTILTRAREDRQSRLGRDPDAGLAALRAALTGDANGTGDPDAITIPAPLDASIWRELLPTPPADDLFLAIAADRQALLLASGLTAADPSIRTLVAGDLNLFRFLYRNASGAFAIVSRHLRVSDGAVVVPGGEGREEIWERLTGAAPSRPASFLRALLTRDQGRLAWYYDTLAGLTEEALRVAWPGTGAEARREQAGALYDLFKSIDPHWLVPDQPYRRSYGDVASLVTIADVADGRLTGPASEAFWQAVFSNAADTRRLAQDQSPPLTMARLVRLLVSGSARDRRDRLEAFRLAQRVFPDPPRDELPAIAAALGGYARFRALLLALERMQITTASTWAAAVQAARHVDDRADDRQRSIAAFQGAVGLVERARHVRTIDAAAATRAIDTLAEAVVRDRRVARPIADWIRKSFVPLLPPLERPDRFTGASAYESTILQALAGPRDRSRPSLEWEGLAYTVDVVAAEHDRLRAVRALLRSPGLDLALDDPAPAALADALTTVLYATALGYPDGPVTLSPDIVSRHDFGFSATAVVREARPWAEPEERQGNGPWRVQGSIIGLDLGLSRLALRRVLDDLMPEAPTLSMNDFAIFTRTVVGLSPGDLTDADRDAIAAAIARGRARVAAAGVDVDALDRLAREARMFAATRQLLPWIAARQPDGVADVFALRDLLWLGQPGLPRARLDRWGIAADGLDGRRVTAMPPPAPWDDFTGRSDVGQIATQAPDLTLRLVEHTAAMQVPAALLPSLLACAVNDYWHEVQVRFADDWLRLTRQAAALDRTRVEDYIAALAGHGPLRAP